MIRQDGLMNGARLVVRVALWANRLFLAGVVLGLGWSLVSPGQFAAVAGAEIAGMRWELLLGLVMGAATDCLLTALAAIIAVAAAGDPFIAANAGRLQRIGWCLLVLQLCELPGLLIARGYPGLGAAAPVPDVSITGWIAVLMVFVLARVFAVGAAMRDDLDGTI